jgi:hypothetical protein
MEDGCRSVALVLTDHRDAFDRGEFGKAFDLLVVICQSHRWGDLPDGAVITANSRFLATLQADLQKSMDETSRIVHRPSVRPDAPGDTHALPPADYRLAPDPPPLLPLQESPAPER